MTAAFEGWTPDTTALVDRAIVAHGGQQQWQAARSIRLPFQSGSGPLLTRKGYRRTFPAPREFEVFPHQCTTIFHGYPDEFHRGCFREGNVRIERANDGVVTLESLDHRRTFDGLAKYRRWSALDTLFFFGYALWHYHVVPFTLGDAQLERVLTHRGTPAGIDVVFPPGVHTHCRRQQFYFGADGRIVRHDYVAEVIGSWARASHFWEDYVRYGGLLVARRRRVVVRVGRYPTPLPVLCVQFGDPVIATQGWHE